MQLESLSSYQLSPKMTNNKPNKFPQMSAPRIWSKVLLLTINCLSLVQNQEGPTKHNWIEITSQTQWPGPDNTSKSPFYLLHGEPDSNPQTLQLNPNLISSIPEIIQAPTLNFKYWSDNSNATFFFLKSTKPDKFQLQDKGQWTQGEVRNLEPDRWNKLAFRVEDLSWTDYTVAFKDVNVVYIERLPISSLPPDPILSHHLTSTHSPNLTPVNITHALLLDPNPQNPLLVYKNWALINLTSPITLPLNESNPNPQTLLTFRFQALPDGTPQTVTLTLEQWEDSCQNDLALANAYIECTISHAPTSKTLTAFKLFLTGGNTDFALWNPETAEKAQKTSFFTESAPTQRTRFKVTSPHSGPTYVALVDSQKPGKDWCYTIEPKNEANPVPSIDVYFTFDLGPSGTKLLTAKSPSTSFCLHEYLGLANLQNYQLTFLIPNGTDLQSNFQFDISKTETDPSASFRVLGPKDQAKLKANQWLLYDRYYTIRSKVSQPDPNIKFSFCDLTLNCFPFERSSNTYILPEYAQTKILPKTPFLRFQIEGLDASTNILDQFTFDYFSSSSSSHLPPINLAPIPQFEHNKPNCPTNFAPNPDNPKSCIQRQFYRKTTIICEPESPGCSNIFSRRLVSSSKYRGSTQNPLKQFAPYQPTQNQSPTQTSLEIPLPKGFPNSDICLVFAYSSTQSPLFISAHLNSKYHSVEYPIGTSPNGTFRACASWFSPTPIDRFFIRFTEQPLFDIDNHFLSLESRPFATQTMQSLTWSRGIYQNAETVSKFEQIFLRNSSPNFAIQSDGSIEFNLNLEALQTSKQSSSISYLRSKWISQPKLNPNTVFLSLRIEGSDLYHEYLESSLIINSPSQTVLHTANLADLNPNILHTFKLSSPADQIQVTIKIKVNLLSLINQKSLSFKITNLLVNDPCINTELGPSIDCANGGVCSREQYDNYLGTCKCSDPLAFRGPNCDQIDYCYLNNRAGLRTCGHLGGTSNSDQQICECQCPKGLKFDYTTQRCLPARVPACGENEIAVLKGSVYACVCLKGTITVDKRCVWYDPCKLKHRMALGQGLATCPEKEADCKATGTGPKDFECICKEGSFNELEIKTSSARCIPNDMKTCQQGYHQVNLTTWECICNKGYHKDPTAHSCLPDATTDTSKCTPTSPARGPKAFLGNDGTTCQCPAGFLFSLTAHTCDIDQALAANFGCSKLELKADDKPGCVCARGQRFDESTRVCPLECDQEAAQACATSRQAQCRFDKVPICYCDPKVDIAFAESAIEAANWRCVSKCDWLLQRRDLEKARCNEEFQTCLPSQMELSCFSNLQDDKIFISNHSSLSSCPTSKYCQCETGFSSTSNGKCAIHIQNQVRFIRDLPFEAPPTSLPRIQDAFIALIHALFAPAQDDKAFHDETGCKLAGKSTIKCTAAFRYEADNSVIQKRLQDNCHPIDEPTGSSKCTYATGRGSKKFQKRDTDLYVELSAGNALIRKIDAPLDVQTIDYCAKLDRCILHSNSYCNSTQPLPNVNSFNCLCQRDFYDILEPESDPTLSTSSYQTMQACTPKNFCSPEHNFGHDYCVDRSARCHSLIEQTNGLYSPKRFCLCADNRLLASPNVSCSSSCSPDYCHHRGVCGQDASDVSHLVCNCDDGWTGEQCSDSVGQSYLPFLIATVVVSLISLSAVGAIVFIYFKRKPNLEEPLDFQIARRSAAAESRLRRIHSDIIHKTSAQTSQR